MEKIRNIVIGVSFFAFVYQLLPFIGANDKLIMALFMLSPFVMIVLVYRVLKYGKATEKTWDDYFYEDFDYRRNGKEDKSVS